MIKILLMVMNTDQVRLISQMEAKFTNLHALVMTLPLGGCLPAVRPPPAALFQSEVLRLHPQMRRYGLKQQSTLGKAHGQLYSLIRALQIVLPDNTRGPCAWPIRRIYEGWPDRFGYKTQRAHRLLDELIRSGWILRLPDGGLLPQAKAIPPDERAQASAPISPPSGEFVDDATLTLVLDIVDPAVFYQCPVALLEVPAGHDAFQLERSSRVEQRVQAAREGHGPRTILAFQEKRPLGEAYRWLPRQAGIRWAFAWSVLMNIGGETVPKVFAELHPPSGDPILLMWPCKWGRSLDGPPVRFHDGQQWPLPAEALQILERRRMFKGTVQEWAEEEEAAAASRHAGPPATVAPPATAAPRVAAAPPTTDPPSAPPEAATPAAKPGRVSPTLEAVVSALTNLGHKPKPAKAAAKAALSANEDAPIEVVLQTALALLRPN